MLCVINEKCSKGGLFTKNATVFPVPVFAFARTSLPANKTKMLALSGQNHEMKWIQFHSKIVTSLDGDNLLD